MKRKIVTPMEMKLLDLALIEDVYDSSYELMRYAGEKIADQIIINRLIEPHNHTVVLAGRGNNGGDALVVAEMLLQKHFDVHIYLLQNIGDCSYETKVQIHLLKQMGYPIHKITVKNVSKYVDVIYEADVIIDGMFGIGLTRPMNSMLQTIAAAANQSTGTVISIDIPSGIHALNGLQLGVAVKANHTMVVGRYKPGTFLQDAEDHHGQLYFIDIGIQDAPAIRERYWMTEADLVPVEKRRHNTHKYTYGHALILGGNVGMMGAPALAALAAYRSGAGLVSVGIPKHLSGQERSLLPDFLTPQYGSEEELRQILDKIDAVSFGMGGGNIDSSFDVLEVLLNSNIPTIIDADGLKLLKPKLNRRFKNVVITPHFGEMAHLLEISAHEIKENPLRYAEELSVRTGLIVLLKGPATIIATPNETYVSTFGTPALAVAGSGDVLDGVITTMLMRGIELLDAVQLAVFIHAKAAEEATLQLGEESLMASDIIDKLPDVIQFLKNDEPF